MTTRIIIVSLALIIMSLAGRGYALADPSETVLWSFGGDSAPKKPRKSDEPPALE